MKEYLYEQCQLWTEEKIPPIGAIANILAVIYYGLDHLNWCGLYLYDETEQICWLGPFQGRVACTRIPAGSGVVGTCAQSRESLIVDDVHTFPGHIACDSASNSEIVLPILYRDKLLAVLDLDSDHFANFSAEDQLLLTKISSLLAPLLAEAQLLK